MVTYLKEPQKTPHEVTQEIKATVSEIIADIERRGTDAVRDYSQRFDDWSPTSFRVSEEEVAAVTDAIDPEYFWDAAHIEDDG